MVNGQIGFENKHPSIEIEWGLWAQLGRPLDLVGPLLAVAYLELWGVAPSFLTETIHNSVEMPILEVKEMVNVLIYLDVTVKIHHLAIFHKLSP